MRKRLFSDEELSRILGECDAGHMELGGGYQWRREYGVPGSSPACCVNQAAYNEPGLGDSYNLNRHAARAFDATTKGTIRDPDKLLGLLEEAGVA